MKNYLLILACSLLSSLSFSQTVWHEIPTGTNQKLNAIDFPTPNVGYIVGANALILKSVDAGQSWQQLNNSGGGNLVDVKFLDENVGFVVAEGAIWRTTNGGQSWEQFAAITIDMCYYQAVFPISESIFFAGGSVCPEGATIRQYDNGSWTTGNLTMNFPDFNQYVTEISFVSPTLGLAATRSEFMLRTVDGGINWESISTGISDSLTSVIMVNDTLCYAGYTQTGSPDGILKSTDGGLTWAFDPNLGTVAQFTSPNYLSVCTAQNGDIYSGAFSTSTQDGLIFETSDGIIWSYSTFNQPINAMASYGSDVTFGVGDNGYLVVNTPIAELGINEANDIDFSLYPNPVQSELTIDNPNSETMEIVILDAYGRILATELAKSGSSIIDCSALTNGMYFVKVKVNERIGVRQFVKSY